MFSINLNNLKEILFLLCLFVLGWEYIDIRQKRSQISEERRSVGEQIDSLHIQTNNAYFLMNKSSEKAKELSSKYIKKIEDQKIDVTKLSEPEREYEREEISKVQAEMGTYDSLNQRYEFTYYDDSLKAIVLLNKLSNIDLDKTTHEEDYRWIWNKVTIIGGVLFISLFFSGDVKRYSNIAEVYKKGRFWFYCQSCGKKFCAKRSHSTNADGSTNFAFCTTCFQNGAFTSVYNSPQEVENEVINHFPRRTKYLRRSVKEYVASLQRWNNRDYEPMNIENYFWEEPLKSNLLIRIIISVKQLFG